MRIIIAIVLAFLLQIAGHADGGKLVLVAGGGTNGNGPATKAKLTSPFGVDFDSAGNMFIVELSGERVHKVTPDGTLTTIGGTGDKGNSGDGGPAAEAQFNGMHSLAIGANDEIYVADTWNNRVRKIDPKSGKVSAFAGTGKKGSSGDGGPALDAEFGGIYCIAFDAKKENLFLADLDNRLIRKVNMKTGIVSTVAGNGKKGVPQDGADATAQPLVDPRAVAVDHKGNVYILERGGNALRVVDAQGKIRTVAGTGKAGLGGDDGAALKALLKGPKHLCIDLDDNVIIADTANHVIRKYLPGSGQIVRLAGTGKSGKSGNGGPAADIEFNEPHGVYVRADGVLFIVDSNNHRVFKMVE